MSKPTLAFAGTPEFAVPALQGLADAGFTIAGVWTQPDRAAGRGRQLRASPVKERALALGIRVFQPERVRDASDQAPLANAHVDVLVVVAYGLLLPPAVLALPRLGCFNIHASLLPRWRGAAPIQRAILAGDSSTGVTIMRMDAGLDTGPMLRSESVAIGENDTARTLQDKLAVLGARMIVDALEEVASGRSVDTRQPAHGVTYAPKIHKSEALIDWGASAADIERRVRAFNPWPVAETRFAGEQLRIFESRALEAAAEDAPLGYVGAGERSPPGRVMAAGDAGIDVVCGKGLLRILRLQSPGRAAVSAADFARARALTGAQLGV